LLGGAILAAAAAANGAVAVGSAKAQEQPAANAGKPPNVLVTFGDDIGIPQISAYTMGLMGYRTPNIDRIAAEGAIFTDAYGQHSCTAGRASFIRGQEPFRTGLLTIGMPGDPHGIEDWMPTIADVMKSKGYATGQFGKNHLGDRDEHLPTNHGFDEFFGKLYHLNAEEEPEGYFYPKDKEFRKNFGPRGVIKSSADGKIEDTGALNTKRMETVDEEFLAAAKDFIDRQAKADKPFFCWFNSTRMHVFTHLKPESVGKTGKGIHADGMVEHDGHVGQLLQQLDVASVSRSARLEERCGEYRMGDPRAERKARSILSPGARSKHHSIVFGPAIVGRKANLPVFYSARTSQGSSEPIPFRVCSTSGYPSL
jgi:arylsulfatase